MQKTEGRLIQIAFSTSLLKTRFFPDLVNSQDYRILLNDSMIGLRFKTNDLNSEIIQSMEIGFNSLAYIQSNSIIFLHNNKIVGIGAGQQKCSLGTVKGAGQ